MREYFCLAFFSILVCSLSACVTSQTEQPKFKTEILQYQSESRGEVKPVITLVTTPLSAQRPLPVVITQHGSNRDSMSFPGGEGKTDEYSSRLIKEGTRRGFAVVGHLMKPGGGGSGGRGGSRTQRNAFAPSPVLKTGRPTTDVTLPGRRLAA